MSLTLIHCVQCQATANQVCAACGITPYCSKQCARLHWEEHHAQHHREASSSSSLLTIGQPMKRMMPIGELYYGTGPVSAQEREAMNMLIVQLIYAYASKGQDTYNVGQALSMVEPNRLIDIYRWYMDPRRDEEMQSMIMSDRKRFNNGRRFLKEHFLTNIQQRRDLLDARLQIAPDVKNTLDTEMVLFPKSSSRRTTVASWVVNPDHVQVPEFLEFYQRFVRVMPSTKTRLIVFMRQFLIDFWYHHEPDVDMARKKAKKMLGSKTDAEITFELDLFLKAHLPHGRIPLINRLLKLLPMNEKRKWMDKLRRVLRDIAPNQDGYEDEQYVVNVITKLLKSYAKWLLKNETILKQLREQTGLPMNTPFGESIEQPMMTPDSSNISSTMVDRRAVYSVYMTLIAVHILQQEPFFAKGLTQFLLKYREILDPTPFLAMLDFRVFSECTALMIDDEFVLPHKRLADFCRMLAMNPLIWQPFLNANMIAPILWRYRAYRSSRPDKRDILQPDSIYGYPKNNRTYATFSNEKRALIFYGQAIRDVLFQQMYHEELKLKQTKSDIYFDYPNLSDEPWGYKKVLSALLTSFEDTILYTFKRVYHWKQHPNYEEDAAIKAYFLHRLPRNPSNRFLSDMVINEFKMVSQRPLSVFFD